MPTNIDAMDAFDCRGKRAVPKRAAHGCHQAQSGMVLLVVLSAIAFLIPLIFSGVEMGRFHLRRVGNELALQEARRYAESGLSQVIVLLQRDGAAGGPVDHLGDIWAVAIPALDQLTAVENQPTNRQLTIVVEDSARYLNLNYLVDKRTVREEFQGVLTRFLQSKELQPLLLEALIDWLDDDHVSTGLGGAEHSWYQMEGRPYGPENKPILAMENLVLLRGWSPQILQHIRSVARTVDPRCDQTGINVNTASQEVLELISGLEVDLLLELRQEKPFGSKKNLTDGGVIPSGTVSPLLQFKSDCFEARIRAQVGAVSGVLKVWLLRKNKKEVEVMHMVWSG